MNNFGVNSKVVCLGPPKEAALYFDRILPLDTVSAHLLRIGTFKGNRVNYLDYINNSVPSRDSPEFESVIFSIIGQEDADIIYEQARIFSAAMLINILASNDAEKLIDIQSALETVNSFFEDQVSLSNYKFWARDWETRRKTLSKRLDHLISSRGYHGSSVWEPKGFFSLWLAPPNSEVSSSENHFYLSLSNLNLIDVSNVSWEHIVEFRKDARSRNKLRRLRTFFTDSFEGKSHSYIQDSLLSRIDQYEEISKLWGFRTAIQTLKAFVDARSVMASGVAALVSNSLNTNTLTTAGLSASVMMGTCGVAVGKALSDRKEAMLDSPVRYLVELNNKLSS